MARKPRQTPRQKRDDAMAKLAGRIAKHADSHAQSFVGARVHDWRILATNGHVAMMARAPEGYQAPRDASRIVHLDGTTLLAVSDEFVPAVKRIRVFATRAKSHARPMWLMLGADRVWLYADGDGHSAREWIPVGCARDPEYHETPFQIDADYLLDALQVAGPDGYLRLPQSANDAVLAESGDGQYAYVIAPFRSNDPEVACRTVGELAERFDPIAA